MDRYINLNRRFEPIETDKENNPESIRAIWPFGMNQQLTWDDLLKKPRVVILAEPGTGKTEELRATTNRLRADGNPAFFCKIELLQDFDVRQSLDIGTSAEFEEWLFDDQEGYFFLDSVDEARLNSPLSFEKALRRLAGSLGNALNRVKIIITSRVSNWKATADLLMFQRFLPVQEMATVRDNEEILENGSELNFEGTVPNNLSIDLTERQEHVVFQLTPLNEWQIRCFSVEKGVDNVDEFIEAIERADSMIFAERPQDLLELIAFWKDKGRLGRHAEMLEFNIKVKLTEHDSDRDVQRPLSPEDANWGAERIATASTVGKKNAIILPDRPIDNELRKKSIDPKEVLTDWSFGKIQVLLDRPIFDEAIYGTVRFHHRSVREYLTARWLKHLLFMGKSQRAIEGLLFTTQYGCNVVIPSMRPIAAWLALQNERVRDRLRVSAPEVLIENGDPSTLPVEFRKSLLIRFTELYAERQHTGISFDITMIRRLADSHLASTVNDLLGKYDSHNDICVLLLKMIWQGQMSDCADKALSFALNDQSSSYIRILAIRAVAVTGTTEQNRQLVDQLLSDRLKLDSSVICELCDAFFPETLTVEHLLEIIEKSETPKKYSSSPLQRSLENIVISTLTDEVVKTLLRGLHKLLKSTPFIERHHCEISEHFAWILPNAIRFANKFIRQKHSFSFDPVVLDLFLGFIIARDYFHILRSEQVDILKDAETWPEFQFQLFWHAIAIARARKEDSESQLRQVMWHIRDLWAPTVDDLERLFGALNHKPLMDDRLLSLTIIFQIYMNNGRPRKLREQIKRTVTGIPELETKLQELLHPKPLTEEQKKWRQQERGFKQRQAEREMKQKANHLEWQQALKKKTKEIKNVGNAQKGEIWERTVYLYERLREKKGDSDNKLGFSKWQSLIDEFGYEVAKNFRDGCVAYWREYDPFSYPNRRTNNTIPWPRIIGLTGLAMEAADDRKWAKKISRDEAMSAAHYSVCDINGFPSWFKDLCNEFPEIVDEVIKNELWCEFYESPADTTFEHTLSAIRYGDVDSRDRYNDYLFELLSKEEPENSIILEHTISLIFESGLNTVLRKNMADLACKRFNSVSIQVRKYTYLIALFFIDGNRGFELLKEWIAALPSEEEKKEIMVNFCAALSPYGNPRFRSTVRDYERIEMLNEFLPLIYQFVKVEEDTQHEGSYSPNTRDDAQQTRSYLLGIIANTPGRQSYDALINLSNSVNYCYSKDRIYHLAKERAAQDAEIEPWNGEAIAEFALSAEKKPRTETELFNLALERLDDLKIDIEEGDESEAVFFQRLTKETEVRKVIASRLKKSSRNHYTVGSEEELADATRTDIRLNTPQVSAPVTIELKIADNWTPAKLSERLENQLIKKYMRVSKYGIFLIVYNGRKRVWKHPITRKDLTFSELIDMLKRDATTLRSINQQINDLEVVGIDFTARSVGRSKGVCQ